MRETKNNFPRLKWKNVPEYFNYHWRVYRAQFGSSKNSKTSQIILLNETRNNKLTNDKQLSGANTS